MKRTFLFLQLMILTMGTYAQTIKKMNLEELEAYINKSEKPLVINFWATFCQPCIEELPYFQSMIERNYKGQVDLLLVSLDLPNYYPLTIASFVKRRKIKAPVAWLNESNADVFCPRIDKSWSGTIPASLFINNKTKYRRFYEEQLSPDQLRKELKYLTLPLDGTAN